MWNSGFVWGFSLNLEKDPLLTLNSANGTENHRQVDPLMVASVQSVWSEFHQMMSRGPASAQDLKQLQGLASQAVESTIQLQLSLYNSAEEVARDEKEVDEALTFQMLQIRRVAEAFGE